MTKPFSPLTAQDAPLLRYVLESLLTSVPSDAACICQLRGERVEVLSTINAPQNLIEMLATLDAPQIITTPSADLEHSGYASALVMPIIAEHQAIGSLILLSEAHNAYAPDHFSALEIPLGLLRTLLHNIVLREMLAIKQRMIMQQGGELLATLTDGVTDGLLMLTPDQRVLTYNRTFAEMFGLPAQAVDQPLSDLIDQMALPRSARHTLTEQWLEPDPAETGEIGLTGTQHIPQDIEWRQRQIEHEGHLIGRLFVFHNATPSRMAARIRAAFLQRITHELRTPLTSIYGFAQFILEASGDDLPDLAREYTEVILRSARHLNQVFTSILDIARADMGELPLHLSEAHLPDVIIDVVARQELESRKRGQQVRLDLDDDMPALTLDVTRITQAIAELVSNAIKYAPEQAIIRVACYRADALPEGAPPDTPTPCTVICVTDSGAGVSEDEAERIFQPLYRGKSAGAVEGAGLGLTIAHSITEMHRGKLWVVPSSKKRPGGRFFLALP